MKIIIIASFVVSLLALHAAPASAECNCVSVAGYVDAGVQASVATADALYAQGDFDGALDLYAKAYAESHDDVLLYAQGMCKWQLGASAEAKAFFDSYVAAGGQAQFKDRAGAAVGAIDSGVKSALGFGGSAAGEVGGQVKDRVGGVTAKPKRVAGAAAIILGIVAVVAVGSVAYNGIHAGISKSFSMSRFDKGFAVGAGISGLVMGASAVYLWGLTAATGAASGAACGVGVGGSF